MNAIFKNGVRINSGITDETVYFYRYAQACIENAEKNILELESNLKSLQEEMARLCLDETETARAAIGELIKVTSRELDLWKKGRPLRAFDLQYFEGAMFDAAYAQMKVKIQGQVGDTLKQAFAMNQMCAIPCRSWKEYLSDIFGAEVPGSGEVKKRQDEIRGELLSGKLLK